MYAPNYVLRRMCFLSFTYQLHYKLTVLYNTVTAELHFSGLTGTANHPDMHKIQIIGFFFVNGLHWQFEIWLLLFTVCTYV